MNGMPKDPLHGITLEMIIHKLESDMGWEEMSRHIAIRCFLFDPSVQSSLKFLRRNPWARKKVENLYLDCVYGGSPDNE
jgi:uncharacterized protein (DUF2132 family)